MKSIETKIAEQNVDASIAQFEAAVNHLIDKVEGTTQVVNETIDMAKEKIVTAVEKYEHVRETVRQPVVIAQDLLEQARIQAKRMEIRMRANPEPYVSWALFGLGMLLCFRAVRNHRRALATHASNRHSWTQQEP